MKYLPIILLAASTAFSQATPPPAATLTLGYMCSLDKDDPGKIKCHKSKLTTFNCGLWVNLIDGTGPKDYGLRLFEDHPGKVLLQVTPGYHTVQMQQFCKGALPSQPATAGFTAVPGHTYSANVLLVGHRKWIPLIYDETDNRMVSLPKPPQP